MQLSDEEKVQLAEVYEKAADYLEEYGWLQLVGGLPGGPRCFVGATASAIGELSDGGLILRVKNPQLWDKASQFAAKVLELPKGSYIFDWNDENGRTQDEVINLLHALANKLR